LGTIMAAAMRSAATTQTVEVVPGLVEVEVAVPRLSPAVR
jgi:hypothetical protein